MHQHASDFNCETCQHRHCDAEKKVNGSQGPAPFPKWKVNFHNGETLESRTCLLPMVSDLSRTLLKLGRHYHAGHLLQSGGVLDQPNLYLQAMEFLPHGLFGSS